MTPLSKSRNLTRLNPRAVVFTACGGTFSADYPEPSDILADRSFRCLFAEDLVTGCVLMRGGRRVAGLPFMDWDRLTEAVESIEDRDHNIFMLDRKRRD